MLNDDPSTQEKIAFNKSDTEQKSYLPVINNNNNYNNNNENIDNSTPKDQQCYRYIKSIKSDPENRPIKLSFNIISQCGRKMLPIANHDLFIYPNKNDSMNKFKLYSNMEQKHYNKKAANILFNLIYTIEDLSSSDIENKTKEFCEEFSKIEETKNFKVEHKLVYEYNKLENEIIKDNLNENKEEKDKESIPNKEKYFSIEDIDDCIYFF